MDTNGAVTGQRAPTIAEVGMGRLIGRICRRCVGTEPQVSPTASPSLNDTSSATSRKIKLNQVVSQVDETEIEPLSEADLLIMFARYEALFGKGQRPPNNREPTSEQLAALRSLIASSEVPYADFAIFSSYGTRIQKKLRFQGLTLSRSGELVQTEMYGPSSLSSWKVSYGVYLNAMIMLDAADLGLLLQYQARIERMHERYCERTWALLYQADVRARLEELPRVRLELKLAHKAAVSAGGTAPYDDARPWKEALRVLADRDKFWTEEFMEPAILIAADKTTVRMAIDNDSVIDRATPSSAAEGQRQNQLIGDESMVKARPRNINRTGRYHEIAEGKYVLNRTGYKLCGAFQEGKCTETVHGTWCGKTPDLAHQCARCAGAHGMCPHTDMPRVGWTEKKGKGKDKGDKGKGKGKRPRSILY